MSTRVALGDWQVAHMEALYTELGVGEDMMEMALGLHIRFSRGRLRIAAKHEARTCRTC